jgi:hypothetical protein
VNYWKGLVIAATLDLAWLMGSPAVTGPDTMRPFQEIVVDEWREPARRADPEPSVAELERIGLLEDSLMTHLNAQPEDVAAMERLAQLYADQGWFDQAIGPLARALQLDAERRSLWVALDRAVEGAGLAKIADAELVRRALMFVESVEMWGHGC